ncbi:hypothetical protein RB195_016089 [Necator americanus]|uniref:Uncharacterized protein n=1 Tax=Necator americanus TaxID=51031 RepID=A0ABR1EA55_NECAM
MPSGRIIPFHILLHVFRGAFGLECYVGNFGRSITTKTSLGKYCAVFIYYPCDGERKGYFDWSEVDIARPMCLPTRQYFACHCNTDLCNMDFKAFLELWKSSPDYKKESVHTKCLLKLSSGLLQTDFFYKGNFGIE